MSWPSLGESWRQWRAWSGSRILTLSEMDKMVRGGFEPLSLLTTLWQLFHWSGGCLTLGCWYPSSSILRHSTLALYRSNAMFPLLWYLVHMSLSYSANVMIKKTKLFKEIQLYEGLSEGQDTLLRRYSVRDWWKCRTRTWTSTSLSEYVHERIIEESPRWAQRLE